MSKITTLRSGGQSGADRGAMDAARSLGVTIAGWCPAGGWAEDYPEPPGVLSLYPEMRETPSSEPIERTEWNIRDSACSFVFTAREPGTSPGTDAGFKFYERYDKPFMEFELGDERTYAEQTLRVIDWLHSLENDAIDISVGGPRASEYPGIYRIAFDVTTQILQALA